MPLSIHYDQILSQFDSLVTVGVINHHPSRVTQIENKGFKVGILPSQTSTADSLLLVQFKYEITESLANKPAAEVALQVPEHTSDHLVGSRPDTFGPGSDIANAHPDLLMTAVESTHLLVINKFCIFRPQLLLLTIDSYQRQHVPLSSLDLAAAWSVLCATEDRFYVMFNCGDVAGASRRHKHMQVIPHPDALPATPGRWRLFPDYDPALASGATSFEYFINHFDKATASSSTPDLFAIYSSLLERCRQSLNAQDDRPSCPHNVVLMRKWILAIPRTRENVDGTTANSAGMMRSVWLKNEQQLEKWIEQGPAWVLSQLGVAASHTL